MLEVGKDTDLDVLADLGGGAVSCKSHQHVTVTSSHEAGVKPEVPGDGSRGPATGERLPRPVQPLHREVTEVSLQ